MFEQIVAIFSVSEIIGSVSSNLDALANVVDGYLSGTNNLRIASIILMLLAFILFLFLVIILYVKSIIAFLKSFWMKKKLTVCTGLPRSKNGSENLKKNCSGNWSWRRRKKK